MPPIYRPCYCTREEVQRALDVKSVAYNNEQLDRNIQAASDDIDGICARRFYPVIQTVTIDWPNFQYTYPWKVYLDSYELAGSPTQVVTGTYLPQPIVIPPANYILRPENEGPPFTRIELRRDLNSFFGGNTTPQQDIGITGPFGYWLKTQPGGTLAVAMTDTTTPSLTMSLGSGVLVGVGDVITIDSERMIVTDAQYINTAIAFNGFTSSPPSANDNVLGVPDGTQFGLQEQLVIDTETVKVLNIVGNNLVCKRGWDGSILSTHTSGTIYSKRQVTVIRGALGTTAATHLVNAPISVLTIPGLVKELAVATASIGLTAEPAAYANLTVRTWQGSTGTSLGQQREPAPGPGLPDLRDRVLTRYGRKARTRVV